TDSPRCVSLRRLLFLQVFVEADAVAERVDDLDAPGVVERRRDSRPQVLVALAGDLPEARDLAVEVPGPVCRQGGEVMRGADAIVQARGRIRPGWQDSEQQQGQGKARLHG